MKYEPGKYKGRIVKWGLAESKEKKTPQFFCSCEILGEIDRDESFSPIDDAEERTVFRAITSGTIDYVIKDLQTLGWNGTDFNELSPDHPNAFDLTGKEVELRCSHEMYKDKDRERWEFAFSGGGELNLTQLDKKGISALNALFGNKLKAASVSKPAQSTAAKASLKKAPLVTAPAEDETEETI